jgi:acetyltransferase-like isoleucine patch superfamily enzyme
MIRKLLHAALACLPWPLRRKILNTFCGCDIHPTARIGFSLVLPRRLIMEEHSSIGHMTVAINLDFIHLGPYVTIGRGNWITGFPTAGGGKHFAHQSDRKSELIVGAHSAITNRHLIDCTGGVSIGRLTTFAGFQSQILTHSIDLAEARQSSAPIRIGDYCFIGTNCVLLGGSSLPSYSVLGAKSLLNKDLRDEYFLYAGCPAKPVKPLARNLRYFDRQSGYID